MSISKTGQTPPYYDRDFVERKFTPEEIDSQGRHLLHRALNIGKAVGFIGSGVAAAYGRPTWTQLIDDPGAEIIRKANEKWAKADRRKLDSNRDLDEDWPDDSEESDVPREVIATAEQLEKAWIEGVSDVDLLPLKGHLFRTMKRTTGAEDDIQKTIKQHVCDDDFVARSAWGIFLEGEKLLFPESQATRLEEIFWRQVDSWETYADLVRIITRRAGLDDEGKRAFPLHRTSGRLSVEQRFLAPLLYALACASGALEEVQDHLEELAKGVNLKEAPYRDDADADRDAALDPARIIMDELEIRRLLTTNYDFELERALERLGFDKKKLRPDGKNAAAGAGQLVAERARGGQARSLVLKKDTAADLVGFGAEASGFDYEIFHLHGRAFQGEDERLVITERDYQDVYMRDAPEAHVMAEALTATMGGNPVIFIGMGMLEADVLRPLRQFVSGPGEQINRSIVALLPTEESRPRRIRASLLLYLRYGVHVTFFGDAEPDKKTGAVVHKDFRPAPWMGPHGPKTKDSAPLYRSIARLGALQSAMKTGGLEASEFANWKNLKSGAASDPATSEKRIELALRDIAWKVYARDSADKVQMAAIRKLVHRLLLSNPKKGLLRGKIDSGLRQFFRELDGRIRTRALCAKLESLVEERQTWWEQWRHLPSHRRFAHDVRSTSDGRIWKATTGFDQPLLGQQPGTVTYRSIRFATPPGKKTTRARVGGPDPIDMAINAIRTAEPDEGRRVFIVHGEKGAGRGSLFHRFSEAFAETPTRGRPYAWGLFTNAAFSTEYSSVVDGITDYLGLLSLSQFDRWKEENRRTGEASPSRQDLLKMRLETLHAEGRMDGRRGLLVLGGAELLFRRRDGTAKNAEIVETLSVFLNSETERRPIDVVIICGSDKLETIFGLSPSDPKLEPIGVPKFGTPVPVPIKTATPPDQLFKARVINLAKSDIRQWMDQELERNGLPTLTNILSKYSNNDLHWRPRDLNRIMDRSFERSIITACTVAHGRHIKDEVRTAREIGKFLSYLGDQSTRPDGRTPAELALSAVLRQYRMLGSPPDSNIDPELYESILKHLAIMSAPVEEQVLLRCPQIRRYLGKWAPADRRPALRKNLQWLVESKLLFQLEPRIDLEEGHAFTRYAVHQSLQGFFFKQIGSPHLELGDSRLFTVSLYASQSADLPAPSRSAHEFIIELLRALIRYPEGGPTRTSPAAGAHRRQADVCALRAALGLVRAAFSLAVVSRFSEFGDPKAVEPRSFGYLEEFRLLLRWMIFSAGELALQIPEGDLSAPTEKTLRKMRKFLAGSGRPQDEAKILADYRSSNLINAFYQDEITWLYNECALVSLAQGNLADAAALLGRAERSNRRVETGTTSGPNGLRIRLNRAIVAIERGELRRAGEILTSLENKCDREPAVRAIARGYEGLVAHLKGRREQATRYYDQAITQLRAIPGEGRALSIFNRHYGNLARSSNLAEARILHTAALAEAETARQYDQVHRVYVSMVLDDLAAPPLSATSARRVLRRLDEVIQYADRMELYSLKIEALMARAWAIQIQGETRSAGEAAVLALSLSTLHGQRLRAISALHMLGTIVADRQGYRHQARLLLTAARDMAEEADYQLVLEKADKRLVELHETT